MIVCSRCQFENPVHHRYCQECGALLVQDASEELMPDQTADTRIPEQVINGSNGIDPDERSPQEEMVHLNNSDAVDLLAIVSRMPEWVTQSLQERTPQSLDRAQRYHIVSSVPKSVGADGFEFLVSDSKRDTPPYLEQHKNPLAHMGSEASASDQLLESPEIAIPLVTSTVTAQGDDSVSLDSSPFPAIALEIPDDESSAVNVPLSGLETVTPAAMPMVWMFAGSAVQSEPSSLQMVQTYFDLQEQLYPSFPRLVDAWDDQGAVIILENRSGLSCLKDMVVQPTVVPPQILHWCHEMTELWEVLSAHQCCQSLLMLDNVRIDEDHILCLRRLYFDPTPAQYTLKDLGQLWQELFGAPAEEMKSSACPQALVSIYQDLATEAIADLDSLRLRLEAAADHIHQNALGAIPPVDGGEDVDPLVGGTIPPDDLEDGDGPVDADRAIALPLDGSDSAQMMGDGDEEGEPSSGIMGLGDDPTIVLPMQLHTLSNAGTTNIGIQRDHNEDFFAMDTQIHTSELPSGRVCHAKGLYILCDGMGGHAAGEVASAAAGDILQSYFQEHWTTELPDEATIHDAIVTANQGIYEQNQADASEGSRRMGTTLVMLLVQDTKAAIAHVGDSRIYRFTRRQGLEQLTVDHEVGQREIARGVAPDVAYSRPDAYQLTQALGPRSQDFIRPDIQFMEMNEDSLFILGSDGLTDNDLLEAYCESHIEPLISTNANLDEGAYQLIELANQVNGHDNITVLLVRVKLRPKLSMLHR